MPRKLRIEHPGAIYHVMKRGDRREDIFKHETNRVVSIVRTDTNGTKLSPRFSGGRFYDNDCDGEFL